MNLNETLAQIADVELLLRARFVEAADTYASIGADGVHPMGDRSVLAGLVIGEPSDDKPVRHRPSAAAISRADEVWQQWLLDYVPDVEHRVLLMRWAASLAVPRIVGSFRSFCKKTGRNRTTAERRIDKAFHSIASDFVKNAKSLREPDWHRVVPMLPEWGRDIGMVAERVSQRSPSFWRADDAKPTHRSDLHEQAA